MSIAGITELVTRRARAGSSGAGPRHANGWFELSFLEVGALDFRLDRRSLELRAGEVGVLAPWVENTPHAHGLIVHQLWLSPERLADAAEVMGARPLGATARSPAGSRVAAIARAFAAGAHHGVADPAQAALADALVLALFARPDAARAVVASSARRIVRRALDRIASDHAAPLTVDDLAADAGLSRFAFHRAFQRAVGASPYRYVTAVRLDHAAALLRSTSDRILDIALACGFNDPGRFARAFRARFGVSPRQYRMR